MDWLDTDMLSVPPYLFEQWHRYERLLAQLVQFTSDPICLEGVEGIGKTTFLTHLMSTHSSTIAYRLVSASRIDSLATLMHEIADAFGLSWSGQSESMTAFSREIDCNIPHKTWVLLVDDADTLAPVYWQALIELTAQQTDPSQQLHVVFSGCPGFGEALLSEMVRFNGRKIHRFTLAPMADEEAIKLLNHMLYHLGIEESSITYQRKKQWIKQAQGNIKQLRELLLPVLHTTHGRGGGHILTTETTQKNKQWWIAIAAIACVGVYGISQVGTDASKQTVAELLPPPKTNIIAEVEAITADPAFSLDSVNTASTMSMPESAVLDNLTAVSPVPSTTETLPQIASELTTALSETEATIPTVAPTTTTASVETSISSVPQGAMEVPTASQVTADSKEATVIASQTSSTPSIKQSKPQADKPAKSTAARTKSTLSPFERRLLTQKESHYTIQLLAASQEKTAKKLMRQEHVAKQGGYYRRDRSGKRSFIVVLGDYPTRAHAQHALETLPPEVRRLQPFIRPMGEVKEEIALLR